MRKAGPGPTSVKIPLQPAAQQKSVFKRIFKTESNNNKVGDKVGHVSPLARPVSVQVDVLHHDEPSICSNISNGLSAAYEARKKLDTLKQRTGENTSESSYNLDGLSVLDSGKSEMLEKEPKGCSWKISVRKSVSGLLVLLMVTTSWVGATQFLKRSYIKPTPGLNFVAPFFACWFCTSWTILFFPFYLLVRLCSPGQPISHSVSFEHINLKSLLARCMVFCLVSVTTNYLYIKSLETLDCTVVTALFATNASFVYLLSWVVLRHQFVGVRVVALILTTTGISLLAYMDYHHHQSLVIPVILASASAAGTAVYKVMFKKVMGEVNFLQVSIFFSVVGVLNCLTLWPVVLSLYWAEYEVLDWTCIPWTQLSAAAALSLVANMLANLSVVITYEHFITLGLVVAIPASALYDIHQNQVAFTDNGMKLAGIVFICLGFLLVLTPANLSSSLAVLVRWRRQVSQLQGGPGTKTDVRTGYIESRLRSPSGRVK